jgi:NAD(P)H-hydrate epimerase
VSLQLVSELPRLPPRPEDSHKGTFGRVLVVGGSRGMSGAVCLAGLGALRGGAGLVAVAAPASIVPIAAAVETSYLTIPLPEDEQGRLNLKAQSDLVKMIPNHTAMVVGPGLGRSHDLTELMRELFVSVEIPMVIDADGINALSQAAGMPSPKTTGTLPERTIDPKSNQPSVRIFTPHPGEFSRLVNTDIETVQVAREDLAVQFALENNIILVLKGHRTIVTDGERMAVNSTGNSGMATGGTGDVLTGLIAALLAQTMTPFEAAYLGVHLHGLAGDLAAAELSKQGMIASDLPNYLPRAWKSLE